VGRSRELARTLGTVTGPEGRGALLAGPAGVGKSHLLDRVVERLTAEGWAPVRAHGDPTRHQPFDAFGDLLPPLAGDPDRWALILRAGVDHLVAAAGTGRPVLVADDLHAFDLASAALLQIAVTEGRLPLVATLRTGESAPDAVVALWKHDLVERIDIAPLTRDETAELAEALVGGPIDADTRGRLWNWTEGNPLLVTDIVEQARLDDGWRRAAGLWRLVDAPARSPHLAVLLGERLAGAPPSVTELVDAVALAGRLPLVVADALVGRTAVAAAERLRLVRVLLDQGWAGVRLDHPLYGELRRAALPAGREAALRDRLLDVVEGLDEVIGAADLAVVAEWYLDTGRASPRTADLLVAAAERAWAGNDPGRAAALARRAWELRPDDRSGLLLVSALARVGATRDLEAVAPVVAGAAGSDRVRALAVLAHALALFQFANLPEAALGTLRRGAATIDDDGWREVLATEAASYLLQMGRVLEAEAAARPLLGSPNALAAAGAAAVVGPAQALQGRIADAIATADLGAERAGSAAADYADTGQYLFHKLLALVDDGQVGLAETLALGAVDDISSQVDPVNRALVALSLGRILRLRGRPATAARWFREAAGAFEGLRRIGFAAWAFAGLSAVLVDAGDLTGAQAAAARCRAQHHPIRVGAAEVERSLAWAHVAQDDIEAAAAAFDRAADRGLEAGELVHAAHALHDLVRVGRVADALGRLDGLRARTDSQIVQAYADQATALMGGDVDGMEAAARTYEALGCELAAAEAWVMAGRMAGGGRRTAAAGRRAAALAARCEGARTPLLAEDTPRRALSDREREVALLAAGGMERRAIAERLVVSPRTIDSHLQRIYQKLGVTSSRGLAEALRDTGDLPDAPA
jgi:DNA-binding NarL/FixJ family response regulator